jgi:hypothetical protein
MSDPVPSRPAPGGVDPLARHEMSPAELQRVIEADARDAVFLLWRDHGGQLQLEFLDADSRPRSIGRRDGVDLQLEWDLRVSGVHARLECAAGEWSVADEGSSTNGTFVNERRVTGRQRLVRDDRIRVGRTIIVFREPAARSVVPTQVDGADLPSQRPTPGQQRVLVALCTPLLSDPPQRLPATNAEIADAIYLTVGAVKMHLRGLFVKFELANLSQHDKRVRLAERAIATGLVSHRDVPLDP